MLCGNVLDALVSLSLTFLFVFERNTYSAKFCTCIIWLPFTQIYTRFEMDASGQIRFFFFFFYCWLPLMEGLPVSIRNTKLLQKGSQDPPVVQLVAGYPLFLVFPSALQTFGNLALHKSSSGSILSISRLKIVQIPTWTFFSLYCDLFLQFCPTTTRWQQITLSLVQGHPRGRPRW